MCFHVLGSQHDTVDGAESCICHQNTGKLKFPDHVFKLDPAFIKAERAENSATSFHGDKIIFF